EIVCRRAGGASYKEVVFTLLEDDVESPTPWETVTPDEDIYCEPPVDPIEQELAEMSAVSSPTSSPPTPPPSSPTEVKPSGGAFTIPLICLGVGVIAMCLLIPAADEVRRLAYERDRLKVDLEKLQKQAGT